MSNWEDAEREYNQNYDPCADKCPYCGSENIDTDDGVCFDCGEIWGPE